MGSKSPWVHAKVALSFIDSFQTTISKLSYLRIIQPRTLSSSDQLAVKRIFARPLRISKSRTINSGRKLKISMIQAKRNLFQDSLMLPGTIEGHFMLNTSGNIIIKNCANFQKKSFRVHLRTMVAHSNPASSFWRNIHSGNCREGLRFTVSGST